MKTFKQFLQNTNEPVDDEVVPEVVDADELPDDETSQSDA